MNDILGAKVTFGPKDEMIWFNGPLSFFEEIKGQMYYFHCFNSLWSKDGKIIAEIWIVQQCGNAIKRALLDNQIDFASLMVDPFICYIKGNRIVKVKPMSQKYWIGVPDSGVYWSRE